MGLISDRWLIVTMLGGQARNLFPGIFDQIGPVNHASIHASDKNISYRRYLLKIKYLPPRPDLLPLKPIWRSTFLFKLAQHFEDFPFGVATVVMSASTKSS